MTKEVLVSISGLQFEVNEDEAVEVITAGEYYQKNNKHYVLYEEVQPEEGSTRSTIKISEDQVDVLKKGANNVHMVFQVGTQNMTYYSTPFGDLLIKINTTKIIIEEEEDLLHVTVEYGLNVNYTHVSDCIIQIKIISKK